MPKWSTTEAVRLAATPTGQTGYNAETDYGTGSNNIYNQLASQLLNDNHNNFDQYKNDLIYDAAVNLMRHDAQSKNLSEYEQQQSVDNHIEKIQDALRQKGANMEGMASGQETRNANLGIAADTNPFQAAGKGLNEFNRAVGGLAGGVIQGGGNMLADMFNAFGSRGAGEQHDDDFTRSIREGAKNMSNPDTLAMVPSLLEDVAITGLSGLAAPFTAGISVPVGAGLLVGKNLIEATPTINEAISGKDATTLQNLDAGERGMKGVAGALPVALSALPFLGKGIAPLGKGAAKEAETGAIKGMIEEGANAAKAEKAAAENAIDMSKAVKEASSMSKDAEESSDALIKNIKNQTKAKADDIYTNPNLSSQERVDLLRQTRKEYEANINAVKQGSEEVEDEAANIIKNAYDTNKNRTNTAVVSIDNVNPAISLNPAEGGYSNLRANRPHPVQSIKEGISKITGRNNEQAEQALKKALGETEEEVAEDTVTNATKNADTLSEEAKALQKENAKLDNLTSGSDSDIGNLFNTKTAKAEGKADAYNKLPDIIRKAATTPELLTDEEAKALTGFFTSTYGGASKETMQKTIKKLLSGEKDEDLVNALLEGQKKNSKIGKTGKKKAPAAIYNQYMNGGRAYQRVNPKAGLTMLGAVMVPQMLNKEGGQADKSGSLLSALALAALAKRGGSRFLTAGTRGAEKAAGRFTGLSTYGPLSTSRGNAYAAQRAGALGDLINNLNYEAPYDKDKDNSKEVSNWLAQTSKQYSDAVAKRKNQ